jgi:DNA helicase-2/ATP-dependent DNA helicase PcrA
MRALVARIVLEDEARGFRTIHKAKSAEFDNVLVCLKDESCIDHILSPGSAKSEEEQEEQRMTYVGLSRARSRLAVSLPSLSPECEAALAEMAVQSIRLP